ncbi:MAG: tetratricopeptide repeat protein [Chlorobi bacterium]|nr:tetratricopeptide repeat protein [Chlorobiota bacterium]
MGTRILIQATKQFIIRITTIMMFLLMISHPLIHANPTKIDSLNNVLNQSANDSTIYTVYVNLGYQWESIDFDSAMVFYNKSIEIADKNNWTSKKAKALTNIGFAYMYVQYSRDAIKFLSEGLELYIEANDSTGMMNSYYNLGYFYATFEDFPKAIEYFRESEEIALRLNHEKRLAGIYNNLGLMYNYCGLYDKANNYNFKSLKLSEKIGDKSVGYTHLNIGLNYHKNGNFEKSLEHHFKALAIFQESNEKRYIALTLKNIGDDYFDFNLDSAEYYFNKAYLIYREINDYESISRYFMVMGNISSAQKKIPDASSYYHKAIDILPEDGSRKLLFAIYSNIIELNLGLMDSTNVNKPKLLDETIAYAKKMNEIALESGSFIMETESYGKLYKVFLKNGDNKLALEYAEKYIVSKDSLFSEQKQKTITELQTKYETEKKELEIQVLNGEKELIFAKLTKNDLQQKKQMIIIYFLIGGFLLVLVFIIIIYKFYRQTKNANTKLATQNKIISKQKEEKEVLLKEIHHRVKNNLQIINSLLNLQVKNIEDESMLSVMLDGQSRVKAMALIHQTLYQGDNISGINFMNYAAQLLNQLAGLYPELDNVKREVVATDIELDIDTAVPIGLILSELITNAYKYAFKNTEGSILISLKREGHDYRLIVKDNGPGLPLDFDLSKTSSIGLRLVRRLSRQLNGASSYEYKNGSVFIITFKDTFGRKEIA